VKSVKGSGKKCKASGKLLTCTGNERLRVLTAALLGCHAVDWSIFTDVSKNSSDFFRVNQRRPYSDFETSVTIYQSTLR
jgi:hypothetical protein